MKKSLLFLFFFSFLLGNDYQQYKSLMQAGMKGEITKVFYLHQHNIKDKPTRLILSRHFSLIAGDARTALRLLEKEVADPKSLFEIQLIAHSYYLLGEHQKALLYYDQAIALSKYRNAGLLISQYLVLLNSGQLDKASEFLINQSHLFPKNRYVQLLKFLNLVNTKQWEEATQTLNQAGLFERDDLEYAEYFYLKAIILTEQKKYKEAIQSLRYAIYLQPQMDRYRVKLEQVEFFQSQFKQKLNLVFYPKREAIEQVGSLTPRQIAAQFKSALQFIKEARYEKAYSTAKELSMHRTLSYFNDIQFILSKSALLADQIELAIKHHGMLGRHHDEYHHISTDDLKIYQPILKKTVQSHEAKLKKFSDLKLTLPPVNELAFILKKISAKNQLVVPSAIKQAFHFPFFALLDQNNAPNDFYRVDAGKPPKERLHFIRGKLFGKVMYSYKNDRLTEEKWMTAKDQTLRTILYYYEDQKLSEKVEILPDLSEGIKTLYKYADNEPNEIILSLDKEPLEIRRIDEEKIIYYNRNSRVVKTILKDTQDDHLLFTHYLNKKLIYVEKTVLAPSTPQKNDPSFFFQDHHPLNTVKTTPEGNPYQEMTYTYEGDYLKEKVIYDASHVPIEKYLFVW